MAWVAAMGDKDDEEANTTELDTHANMVVVGRQATIISRSGRNAEVWAFSNECSKLEEVPIVDAAIAYDCGLLATNAPSSRKSPSLMLL
jgi:hypothetical protein